MILFGLDLMSRDGAILIFGWLLAVASLVIFGGLARWIGLAA